MMNTFVVCVSTIDSDMSLLALALYIHSVSTSLIDSKASENAVIILKKNASGNQREVLLVDPTLLFPKIFGTHENSSGPPSNNTRLSETSNQTLRQILGNETGPEEDWLNDDVTLLLNHLMKEDNNDNLEDVQLYGSVSPLTPKPLGKEALPWLINDPGPNRWASLKEFKTQGFQNETAQLPDSKLPNIDNRQVLNNKISQRWLYSNSGPSNPFTPINQKISGNATNNLATKSPIPRQLEIKETTLDALLWLSNDSSPWNLLTSLQRSRRQAGKETDAVPELPRWPGMPQTVLREQYIKTSHVKRKILNMMLQSLYSAQERLWPLGPLVQKYDHLAPYRMAFIFMKLDQLVHEGHSIYMYLRRQNLNIAMTMTRRLQLYTQIMRRNVDVTYLVDYIMERVPRDQVVRIRQWVIRNEQETLMKRKVVWDKSSTKPIGRPTP